MNEKEFTKQLDLIAQEETPENMNIWDNIERELQNEKSVRMLSNYRWLRYVAAILILVLISGAGYAYYSLHNLSDPTLPTELITDLNLSQTVDDVTVTVDWAYADAYRASVEFTTSFMSDVPLSLDPNCGSCSASVRLETADGQQIPPAFGGGGGGGGGDYPPNQAYLISFSSGLSYDTSAIQNSGDSIELVLTVRYDPQNQMQSGGGGGSDDTQPTAMPTIDPALIPVREYRFEFTIPYYPVKTGTIDNTSQTVNGINFELDNFSITPSLLYFDLCYSLPTAEEWYANVLVYTGTKSPLYATQHITPLVDLDGRTVYTAYPNTNMETYKPEIEFDYETMQACGRYMAQAPYKTGDVKIMIPYLFIGTSSNHLDESQLKSDQSYFASLGIEFTYTHTTDLAEAHAGRDGAITYPVSNNEADGWYIITISAHPDSMTVDEAIQYLTNNWWRKRYKAGLTQIVHIGS